MKIASTASKESYQVIKKEQLKIPKIEIFDELKIARVQNFLHRKRFDSFSRKNSF